MFAPNLRRKIFGWLERLKNSAGIRLSHKIIRRRRGMPKNSARRLATAAEGSTPRGLDWIAQQVPQGRGHVPFSTL